MYQYLCFGLNIKIDIALPLRACSFSSDETDVWIKQGRLPDFSQPLTIANDKWQCAIWRENGIPHTAIQHSNGDRYYVKNGKDVTLDLKTQGDKLSPEQFAPFSFLVLSTLLYHRGYFQLHGSALVKDGKGYIFMGDSGAGKSTTVYQLIDEDTKLIADDVCLIKYHDQQPYLYSGIPFMKVMKDVYQPNPHLSVYSDLEDEGKYFCDLKSTYYHNRPVPIDTIFDLSISDDHKWEIGQVNGMQKFECLSRNPARPLSVGFYGLESLFHQGCFALSSKVNVIKVQRPQDGFIATTIKTHGLW